VNALEKQTLNLILLIGLTLSSCAPPEEPESYQKGGSFGKDSTMSAESMEEFNFGGAPIGDSDTQEAVKACVDKGLFYERSAAREIGCTSYPLAKLNCTDEGVKSAMSAGIRNAYQEMLANSDPAIGLSGYTIDQCLDCPTANANPVCASAVNGNRSNRPGFLIMFLKQDGSKLNSRMQFIPKN
jgi:hypothetical protein